MQSGHPHVLGAAHAKTEELCDLGGLLGHREVRSSGTHHLNEGIVAGLDRLRPSLQTPEQPGGGVVEAAVDLGLYCRCGLVGDTGHECGNVSARQVFDERHNLTRSLALAVHHLRTARASTARIVDHGEAQVGLPSQRLGSRFRGDVAATHRFKKFDDLHPCLHSDLGTYLAGAVTGESRGHGF